MRRDSTEGVSPQPARLLRLPQEGTPAPLVTAMAWRTAGQAASSAPSAITPDGRNAAPPPALQASQEMQRQIEAARQQGRAEGEAQGAQRAGQRLDPLLADLSAMLGELAQLRPRLRAELQEDTVKLALAIARRVLHRELSADPEAILGLVMAAFQKLNAREAHCLRLCPRDAAVLQEHRARLNLPDGLEITRDPALPKGSVVFETSRGELDASVDTQLVEIERGLTDLMRRQTI